MDSDEVSQHIPTDPAANASAKYDLVKGSDDFSKYKDVFAEAASDLIKQGVGSGEEFKEMGGWVRSTSQGEGVYFTYCGEMRSENKVYLNAITGKIQ